MLEPLELRSYPSCYNSLSWSADGELAIAAGEIVYVLSPKLSSEEKQHDQAFQRPAGLQWDITKLKTNAFTLEELPLLLPEPGATFSIGEEQSISHAVSIAWSPPRLAVYRKCMLAVLTSNSALSLWQATDGASKWNRVMILNHSLRSYFKGIVGNDNALLRRKQRIKAFSWSSPLLTATQAPNERDQQGYCSSYRMNFLIVSNETNDIVVLRISPPSLGKGVGATVLSHYSLSPLGAQLSRSVEQGSLFAELAARKVTVTIISCSPWMKKLENTQTSDSEVWKSLVALMYGSDLKILQLETEVTPVHSEAIIRKLDLRDGSPTFQPSSGVLDIKGPLHWVATAEHDDNFGLAAGMMSGFVLLTIPKNAGAQSNVEAKVYREKFDPSAGNWYPISGFTSIRGIAGEDSTLYAMTLSSLHSLNFPSMDTQKQQSSDDDDFTQNLYLVNGIERFRDRFDLDYDLGGMSIAKTWGLCSHRGWIVTCATFHPTDMVQHTTSSQERTTVFFAPPCQDRFDHTEPGMPWHLPIITPEGIHDSACKIIQFTLEHQGTLCINDPWTQKLLYTAACCVIVHYNSDPSLITLAQGTIQALTQESRVDLSQEITHLHELEQELPVLDPYRSRTKIIPPKSGSQLECAGGNMFENCDICGSGIEWFSPVESQCAEGHLFGRCALTFLSIQDPSISKRCSRCEKECLDDNSAALSKDEPGGLLRKVLNRFDECPYCGSKFKA
ncbi:hypothetical protein FQN49_004549 [Arthroderma sp. PD_2]|nr:hypothetical protein FQN49_004549 [Arthroderma sp. PD_2]